jgi:hypothetical protein
VDVFNCTASFGTLKPFFYAASLDRAIVRADQYIEDNFEVAKTTEQKLAEALAEIDALKLKLHTMPLSAGQRVRVILEGDDNYQRVVTINSETTFGGRTHYELTYPDGGVGLYLRSEIEPV